MLKTRSVYKNGYKQAVKEIKLYLEVLEEQLDSSINFKQSELRGAFL